MLVLLLLTLLLVLVVLTLNPSQVESTAPRFYDTQQVYPDLVQRIQYPRVLDELQRVNSQLRWIPWPEPLANVEERWQTLPLYGFGHWSKQSSHFPQLKAALAPLLPTLKLATFSRLRPGTRLDAHHGWASHSNHILRSHLLLTVPRTPGSCRLYVQDENGDRESHTYHQCGQWMTFDDSKLHWACNDDQTEDRVVLIVDMERPPSVPIGTSTSPDSTELHDFIRQHRQDTA